MILITGATGHLGKATIDHLLQKGVLPENISALARNAEKAADLISKGINVKIGDYYDLSSLTEAFAGVDKLFFISSGDLVNRTEQHQNVVNAATKAGVKHIIYTSIERQLGAEPSPIEFASGPVEATEDLIKSSGLNYTILKNNFYMDAVSLFIGDKVLESGVIYAPVANGKIGFTLRDELAEVSANILISEGHKNKTYQLSNVETYSYTDAANFITEISGKRVVLVSPKAEEYIKSLTEAGVPEDFAGMLAAFALAQAYGEFNFSGNDLEQLLGRKPTTLKEFLTTVFSNN